MGQSKIRVGVIGVGHWGPNLVRCFADDRRSEVAVVCDTDGERLRRIRQRYPELKICSDAQQLFRDDRLDAIVVATSSETHQRFARMALEAGKHVLVEKPMSTELKGADELVAFARRHDRILMVGHIFLYNLAVRELKRIIDLPTFGGLRYMYSRRTNLGPVRQDVHAGWDLAAHDISIFLYLKGETPTEITASAQTFIQPAVPDLVFATLYFEDGTVAHLHTSWLDPQKVRQLVLVGGSQMIMFDDMNLTEPLRIYNKSWKCATDDEVGDELVDTFGAFRVVLTQGDVIIPPISTGEPLRQECGAFLDAILSGEPPLSDGQLGVEVVRVLEALDRSIADRSRRVPVEG